MAADRSRLAAALAYKQAEDERRRRMLESIPTPADTTPAQPAPQADLRTNLENLSIGLGEGLTNQLEGIKGIITDPVGTAKGVYEAGKAVVRDPAIIASALRQMGQKAMSGPLGAGEVIGEMIGPRKTGPVMAELDVYHGTPHRFPATEANPLGEFDASKIGTGEGAQAYGHGVYLAEARDVASSYAIPRGVPDVEGLAFERGLRLSRDARIELMRQANSQRDALEAARMLQNASREARTLPVEKLADTIQAFRQANEPQLYKADLPDEMIDRMLDWDKPLSEQPAAVQKLLIKHWNPDEKLVTKSGESLWQELSRPGLRSTPTSGGGQNAAEWLKSIGIPGIKYLDEGSRNTAGKWIAKHPQGGETAFNTEAELNAFLKRNPEMSAVKPKQTRNFVVFPGEEKKVRILERK